MSTSWDWVNPLVTLIAGFVAMFIYVVRKQHERRDAATLVVMDIRRAEQVLALIDENTSGDFRKLSRILFENNWAKHKHLFVSRLSMDDFALLNIFFDGCAQIDNARSALEDVFYENLRAKSGAIQGRIAAIANLATPEGQAERQRLIDSFGNDQYVYAPDEPKQRILRSRLLIHPITWTNAFERLKSIAVIK
jgi:hypothetical protein